jgi:hypothetical protein
MRIDERRQMRKALETRRRVDDLVLPERNVDLVAPFLELPGLRALWPMSATDYQNPYVTDVSGHGYDLTAVGAIGMGHDPNGFAPIAQLTGAAGSYLSRADGGVGNWADVLGTETYIRGVQRGLTLGGWFWWSALPSAIQYLIAKDNAGASRQYVLLINAANQILWQVWPGPVNVNSGVTIKAGWNHLVGMYDNANQDLHVVLNGVVATNAGAAPAALSDSGAAFTIGATAGGATRFTGYLSVSFLCAAFASTAAIVSKFEQTRGAYGV